MSVARESCGRASTRESEMDSNIGVMVVPLCAPATAHLRLHAHLRLRLRVCARIASTQLPGIHLIRRRRTWRATPAIACPTAWRGRRRVSGAIHPMGWRFARTGAQPSCSGPQRWTTEKGSLRCGMEAAECGRAKNGRCRSSRSEELNKEDRALEPDPWPDRMRAESKLQ